MLLKANATLKTFLKDYPEPHSSNNSEYCLSTDIFSKTLLTPDHHPSCSSVNGGPKAEVLGRGHTTLQTSPGACGADTHVFWWARWMQLKRCPFSGSVLYMVGYCEDNKIPWIEWSRAALSVELQPTSKIIYPQATSTLPLTGDHFLPDTTVGSQLSEADSIYFFYYPVLRMYVCASHTREGGSLSQTPCPWHCVVTAGFPTQHRHPRGTAPSHELSDATTF